MSNCFHKHTNKIANDAFIVLPRRLSRNIVRYRGSNFHETGQYSAALCSCTYITSNFCPSRTINEDGADLNSLTTLNEVRVSLRFFSRQLQPLHTLRGRLLYESFLQIGVKTYYRKNFIFHETSIYWLVLHGYYTLFHSNLTKNVEIADQILFTPQVKWTFTAANFMRVTQTV